MKQKRTPKVRISAFPAYWLLEKDSFANSQKTIWSTGERIKPGDIQIFAISTDLRDASELKEDSRVDAVHSIWEAITPPKPQYGNAEYPIQAEFRLLVKLDNPVPKTDLIQKDLLKNNWPQGSKGKIFHSAEEVEKLIDILTKNNPKQRQVIFAALGRGELPGTDYEDREKELFEDDPSLTNESEEVITKRIKRYKKIVDKIKVRYGNKCQVEECNFTFRKKNGDYYSEAHHLIPLSEGGLQKASNIVILCANHHRMLHYANVKIGKLKSGKRRIRINGTNYTILYK
jgi:hypothetical protein